MAWAWNDPIDEGTDWTAAAFQEQFRQAIYERALACGMFSTIGYGIPVSVGQDIQGVTYRPSGWPYTGPGAPNPYHASRYQQVVEQFASALHFAGGIFFIDPDLAIAGTNTDPNTWMYTLARLRSAAGLNAGGFTRKFPREIATPTATVFVDGDNPAAGDNARALTDGTVYTYTTGAWVKAAAGTLPTLATKYGIMQAGDYIGPWVWQELRACLNRLICTAFLGLGDSNPLSGVPAVDWENPNLQSNIRGWSGTGNTAALATAAADAATVDEGVDNNANTMWDPPHGEAIVDSEEQQYGIYASKSQRRMKARMVSAPWFNGLGVGPPPLNARLDWYAMLGPYTKDYAQGPYACCERDAAGNAIPAGVWAKFDSQVYPANTTELFSRWFGYSPNPPGDQSWPVALPWDIAMCGWGLVDPINNTSGQTIFPAYCLAWWNVAGGFAQQP